MNGIWVSVDFKPINAYKKRSDYRKHKFLVPLSITFHSLSYKKIKKYIILDIVLSKYLVKKKPNKRNTFYWDAALKSKNLGISACIKHAFWPLLDYGFNVASKNGNFGLNVAFNIEILINRIKIYLLFLKSKQN